jgi:hypothetical protein
LIAAGQLDGIADPRLHAIAGWAGEIPPAGYGPRRPLPFPAAQAPELIGVAVTFHYLNRMVNVFLQSSPLPAMPAALSGPVQRLAARLMGALAGGTAPPGAALELLPPAPVPPHFGWAADRQSVASAFARAGTAIEEVAEAVPGPVRRLVEARVAAWAGEALGINSRPWIDAVTTGLEDGHLPPARLALLTAFASYQVTPAHIEQCRRAGYDDAKLVALTSWASFAAAREIGSRHGERIALAGGTA